MRPMYYTGAEYAALWTRNYTDVQAAMVAAGLEFEQMLIKSRAHDTALTAALTAVGGEHHPPSLLPTST